MSPVEIAAGLAVLAGALTQSAVGFGFSLVCAPMVFAAARTPEHAIWLLLFLSLEVNLLTLATEGRRPHPLLREVAVLLAWSVPGMALGVVVLRAADASVLQVLVTVAVFGGLAVRRWAERRAPAAPVAPYRSVAWWAPPAAGLSSGALATSVSASGPPLVLYLIGRGIPPLRLRDSLTAFFLGASVLGPVVLALGGAGGSGDLPGLDAFLALGVLAALGHLLGRPIFALLAERHYERALTAVLVASALAGLLVALI